jgi:ferredoxin/flavodoxin
MGVKVMSTAVCYFSGTGNSLVVARGLAGELNADFVSMPAAARRKTARIEAETVVIVFPAYMAQLFGVPLVVDEFIKRLEDLPAKVLYAVVTCGGYRSFNALPATRSLARTIRKRGGRIRAGYAVRLPMNTLDYSHIPIPINKDHDRMFSGCEADVRRISQAIAQRKRDGFLLIKVLLNMIMTPMYLALQGAYYGSLRKNAKEPRGSRMRYAELVPLTDRSIFADEKCDGCGICSKVCPVRNIAMGSGKPAWLHRCEMCLACVEWCPNRSIHHGGRAEGKYYHHPSVSVKDMLRQSRDLENQ